MTTVTLSAWADSQPYPGTGRKNDHTVYSRVDLGLFLVADGMAGEMGEYASAAACSWIFTALQQRPKRRGEDMVERIRRAFVDANAEIVGLASDNPQFRDMKATVGCLQIENYTANVANLGNTRVYYLPGGSSSSRRERLEQLTVDHSDGARNKAPFDDPSYERLYNYLGNPEVDTFDPFQRTLQIKPGDRFLVCSFAVAKAIGDAGLEFVLRTNDTAEAAGLSIMRGLEARAKGNHTVVVVDVD